MVLDFTGMVMETAVDGSVKFLSESNRWSLNPSCSVITISGLDFKTMQAFGRKLGTRMSCQVRFPEIQETSR